MRRWPNIEPTLGQCVVFAGYQHHPHLYNNSCQACVSDHKEDLMNEVSLCNHHRPAPAACIISGVWTGQCRLATRSRPELKSAITSSTGHLPPSMADVYIKASLSATTPVTHLARSGRLTRLKNGFSRMKRLALSGELIFQKNAAMLARCDAGPASRQR